jgi:peptidoglycan/LPS O-acetylase OafA/YrhL
MKIYKTIDACLQLLLIAACPVYLMLNYTHGRNFDTLFFACYFIVGGVQVLSCIIHLAAIDKSVKLQSRKAYHTGLLIIACLLLLSLPFDGLIIPLIGLIFIAPIMAILYCVLCFKELKLFKHEK